MSEIGKRLSFLALAILTLAAWMMPLWEYLARGQITVITVASAAFLTTMLVMWPFLTEHTHKGKSVRDNKARMCVECHAVRWPSEETIGFCLRCGSTRRPVRVGY